MTHAGCSSGDTVFGALEWGSHLCHLYHTSEELLDAVLPFFAAGLNNNEQCVWITSDPDAIEAVSLALAERVPGLQSQLESGQMRIMSYAQWIGQADHFEADALLDALVSIEQAARAQGYSGVRAVGQWGFFKTRGAFREFQRYESRVSETLAGLRIIAMCHYDMATLEAGDVLDVMRYHHLSVSRHEGAWEALGLRPAGGGDAQRIATLERALRLQERVTRAKDDFLAMLGHELRNPLAPMTMALQLMKLRGVEFREREILERQVNHLTRLVDDLLDISRIERGRVELRKRPVEFSQPVIRAIEVVSPLIEQRQQKLDIQVPLEGLLVDGDPDRLAQVLSNLLTNASKYSDPRSQIRIEACRSSGNVRCTVKDTGIGIAPEMLEGIFDPFVQQPEAVDRSRGGLGLGLAIVRSLVVMHGGSVRAASDGLGHGSEFTVQLPALESNDRVQAIAVPSEQIRPARVPKVVKRVLVVDDNVDAAEMLKQALQSLGHDIEVAHNGPAALSQARSFRPDVVLVDIGLPEMSGYDLAREFQVRWGEGRSPQLIALTGHAQHTHRERSRDLGFTHHLVKPVDLGALSSILAETAQ